MVTGILVVADADLTVAALVLLLVVIGASILGFVPGVVAALSATAGLTYWFTPPYHSFPIDQADDIVALRRRSSRVVARGHDRSRTSTGFAVRPSWAPARRGSASGSPTRSPAAHPRSGARRSSPTAWSSCSSSRALRRSWWGRERVAPGTAAPVDDVIVRESPVGIHLPLPGPLLPGERARSTRSRVALGTALERARLDAEAREQRVRADLVRSRAAFLATVTHDLRTPLATLKTATTTLCLPDGVLAADERPEVARAAHHEVDRLIRIVDKTLELSRIRSGALTSTASR